MVSFLRIIADLTADFSLVDKSMGDEIYILVKNFFAYFSWLGFFNFILVPFWGHLRLGAEYIDFVS